MGSITWKPNANGYWTVGANWSGGVEPGAADNVTLSSASAHTIYYNTTDTVTGLISTDDVLALQGGTLTVSGAFALAGGLNETGGFLVLGGAADSIAHATISDGDLLLGASTVLTLTGATTFGASNNTYGARIHGAGTLATNGVTTIVDYGNTSYGEAVLGAGLTWVNTGTVNDAGVVVAYFTPGTAFTLINRIGAVYDLTSDDASIDNGTVYNNQGTPETATSAFTNAGTLEKTGGAGGTSYIYAALNSTGTIDVATGTLALENGGTLGGTIIGAGSLALDSGNFVLTTSFAPQNGLLIQGVTVAIPDSVTIAGGFSFSSGEINLAGGTLSVTSASLSSGLIDGSGTLSTSGTTNISYTNALYVAGGVDLVNSGVVNIQSSDSLYLNYYNDGAATFTNLSGASLNFLGDGVIAAPYGGSSGLINNAGTLAKTGGTNTSYVQVAVQDTGTISIASGTIEFDDGGTFSGVIVGAGTVAFGAGIDTLVAGTSLGVSNLLVDGSTLVLGGAFTYAGSFGLSGGDLDLNGTTFGVKSASLSSGVIDGSGTLSTSGTTSISYTNALHVAGGVDWVNSGVVNIQSSDTLDLNYYNDGAATFTNLSGASLNFAGDGYIVSPYGGSSGLINNAGTLAKTGGTNTSYVQATVQDTGTISIASGTIEFDDGGTFSGAIFGAGTVAFGAGIDMLVAGTSLGVSNLLVDGSTLVLGGAFTYAGSFGLSGGDLDLNGTTFGVKSTSLSSGVIDGSGTLSTSGTTSISYTNALYVAGGVDWVNSGVVNIQASDNFYLNYQNDSAATFTNLSGATLNFLGDGNIASPYSGLSGFINNAGTLAKTGGTNTSYVQVAVQDTGTINVASGTMEFDDGGTFSGAIIGKGTVSFQGANVNFGSLSIANSLSLLLQPGALTLFGNTTIATSFDDNISTGFDNSSTLSLTGSDVFGPTTPVGGQDAYFGGSGVIATSGSVSLSDSGTSAELILDGGPEWSNTGVVTDNGVIQLGSSDGAAYLVNGTTGTFDLHSDDAAITNGISYDIYGDQIPVIGTFTNAGLLAKNGGSLTNTINATLITTGTLQTNAGTFALEDGGTLGGKILSASHISLASGDFFVNNLTQGGTLTDAAQIDQTGAMTLGSGSIAGVLSVAGLYNIDNDSSILLGTTAATTIAVTSTGSFGKLGGTGTSTIAAAVADAGSIFVNSGKLLLAGAVTGAGGATIANGATLEAAGSTGSSLTVTLGTSSRLNIDQTANFKAKIANFVVGDVLDIGSLTVTSATGSSSGVLTLKNGTNTVGTLSLAGNHVGDVYSVGTDGAGGTLLGIVSNSSTWTGGTADWTVASDWSGGVPMTDTNAVINGTGAKTITIGAGEADTVKSLTLSDANATLAINGTLAIGTSFAQTNGTVELGGTINGGTIDVTGGDFAISGAAATFNNVLFEGAVDMTQSDAELQILGGAFTGPNGAGNSTMNITGNDAGLFGEGIETLNNAVIILGNSSGTAYVEDYDPNGTGALFTLGTSVSVTQSGLYATVGDNSGNDTDGLFNSGAITGAVAGGTFAITGNLFENDGLIAITNGDTLAITTATFTSAGTLSLSGSTLDLDSTSTVLGGAVSLTNSTLNLGDSVTTGQLLAALAGGDTVNLSGTLDNTGATLDLTTTIPVAGFTLAAGTILNGTLLLPAGTLAAQGGELLNVTVDGGLALNAGTLKLQGTQIENAAGTAPGAVKLTNAALEYDGYSDIANAISMTGGTLYITGEPITTNLSTGVDAFGNPLAEGAADPHWSDNIAGPAAVLNQANWAGIGLNPAGNVIGVYDSNSEPAPPYVFTEVFTLTAAQAAAGLLSGSFFFDNGGTILLNGHSLSSYSYNGSGPGSVVDSNYLVTGLNTLSLDLTVGDQATDGAYFFGGLASTAIDAGTTIQGTGLITDQPAGDGASAIINNGVVAANVAAGTLTIAPTLFNDAAVLSASNGGILTFSTLTTFTNLSGGILTGGTYAVAAGSTIELAKNTKITTDAADIVLSGTSSVIQGLSGSTQIKLESTLATIASTGTLALLAGRNYTTALALNDAGQLALGGTTLTAASLTIAAGGTLSGTGLATNTIIDNGVIASAAGGTLKIAGVTGTGTLLAGGVLEVAGNAAATDTALFAGAGATLAIDTAASFAAAFGNLGAGDIIDFTSLASATATISGTTLTVHSGASTYKETINSLAAGTVFTTGTDGHGGTDITFYQQAAASLHSPEPVAFGQVHAGATLVQALAVSNTAPANAYSESLDGSIASASTLVTAAGSFALLAAGSTSTALSVTLAAGAAGIETGTAIITLASDGTGVDGRGTTSLGTQTVNLSATVFAYATAAAIAPVNLGQAHAGSTLSQFLILDNSAVPGAYSENLDASFSGTSLGLSASGSVSELAAGTSNGNSLSLSISPGTAGLASGTATLTLLSDGAGIDTLASTTLAPETITAAGTLFNLATAAAPVTLNFGQHHAGSAYTQTIVIADTAAKGAYSENLDASFSGTSSNLSASGTIPELAAGSSNSTAMVVTLHSAAGGAVTGSTTINLTSDGSGIDSLGTTALAADTLAVSGTLFNYATASITSKTLNFGIVHVGGTVDQYITLSNTAVKGSFSESLDASFSGTSSAFKTSGSLSKLAAGSTSNKLLEVLLNTGTAGTLSASSTLKLTSDGGGIDSLGTTALSNQNITITGTVNNYATSSIETVAGAGTLSGSGTTLALNLGSVAAGGTLAETLGVLNSATGPADLLSGSFITGTSAPFSDTGFNSFASIAAGSADSTLGISLSDLTAGTYTETIVLDAAGSNTSGYSGTLAPETLVVTGTVTSGAMVKSAATNDIARTGAGITSATMAFAAPKQVMDGLAAPSTALTGTEAFTKLAELRGNMPAAASAPSFDRLSSNSWQGQMAQALTVATSPSFATLVEQHLADRNNLLPQPVAEKSFIHM